MEEVGIDLEHKIRKLARISVWGEEGVRQGEVHKGPEVAASMVFH